MGFSWHGVEKSESENLGGNNIFENAERKNNFEGENVGAKNLLFGITNILIQFTLI